MSGAAFFDLDRTLLRRASGPAFSAAMRQTGVVTTRLPFERLLFGAVDRFGESLGAIALARQASIIARGRHHTDFDTAAELAAEELAEQVEPFGRMLIEEHHAAGRTVVLATTTPEHLVRPFAERLGLDDVIATRYDVGADGRFTGSLDGPFVWSSGKLRAVRTWAREHDVDLADCFAYSDSVYDTPLLSAVGQPGAVNPDPRLFALAVAKRWPILSFDTSPGVLRVPVLNLEIQQLLTLLVRPEVYPYARFRVDGLENVPASGPAILVGNHRSYFDLPLAIIAIGRTGRTTRFMGKRELFATPGVGSFFRAIGGISVDRYDEREGSADAYAAAKRALAGGELLGMMPQGTIPRGPAFFEPGLSGYPGAARLAHETRVPVIPFALWGTEKVWPRSSRLPRMTNLLDPPEVHWRFGPPVELKYRSVARDMERIFDGITDLLPPEVAHPPQPTLAELASTYPDGEIPEDDRQYAVDADLADERDG